MALLHTATLTPTKAQAIADWLPTQPWAAPSRDLPGDLELLAAYRFDDPEGEVGVETHLVRYAGSVLQVPLTYRSAPLAGAVPDALVTTMEHSALGRRWVYDGCADPAYLSLLAALTLTGVGQAASLGLVEGRQVLRAPTVVLSGGGWTGDRIAVDDFGAAAQHGSWTVVRSPELELRLARRPLSGTEAHAGPTLLGTWAGQDQPITLATATLLAT